MKHHNTLTNGGNVKQIMLADFENPQLLAKKVRALIESSEARSAWRKGIKSYALDLCENIENASEVFPGKIEEALLNGADNWEQYSYGGCALIYDEGIAKTLCSPSELKRCLRKDGSLRDKANARETWLDVQARALYQACRLIKNLISANREK